MHVVFSFHENVDAGLTDPRFPTEAIKKEKAMFSEGLSERFCGRIDFNGLVFVQMLLSVCLIHEVTGAPIHDHPAIPTQLSEEMIEIYGMSGDSVELMTSLLRMSQGNSLDQWDDPRGQGKRNKPYPSRHKCP